MPTGIVLAGGRSTRFGDVDKAFATFQGKPLLEHVLDGVSPVVDRIVVSCRRDQTESVRSILEPRPTGGEIVVDERLIGPLGGIADGLSICESEWVIVVGCDFPFVDGRLLDALNPHGSIDAVVPRIDRDTQPLCAHYRTQPTYLAVQSLLETGAYRVKTVPEILTTTFVDVPKLPFNAQRRLQNINTRSDLERIENSNRFARNFDVCSNQ